MLNQGQTFTEKANPRIGKRQMKARGADWRDKDPNGNKVISIKRLTTEY